MSKYVWTAKDKFGNSVVRDVTANTIENRKPSTCLGGSAISVWPKPIFAASWQNRVTL